jgi:hypothetical protein
VKKGKMCQCCTADMYLVPISEEIGRKHREMNGLVKIWEESHRKDPTKLQEKMRRKREVVTDCA